MGLFEGRPRHIVMTPAGEIIGTTKLGQEHADRMLAAWQEFRRKMGWDDRAAVYETDGTAIRATAYQNVEIF